MSNDNIKNEIFVALCLCYREFFCDKKDGNFKWAETIKKTNLVELDEIHAKKKISGKISSNQRIGIF